MKPSNPFGLHYEETAPEPEQPQLEYLQQVGLSIVITDSGPRPFVEWAWQGLVKTSTRKGDRDAPDVETETRPSKWRD